MQFNWRILVAVFVVNSIFMVLMNASHLLGQLPPRRSLIPETEQKFLYFWDFWVMVPGDVICVPLIVNVFVHLVFEEKLTFRDWVFALILACSWAWIFILLLTGPNHKMDFNNHLSGELNISGWVHLVYFSLGWAMGWVCLTHLVEGNISGPVMYFGVAGTIVYFFCQAMDHITGNFAPLTKL